MDVGVTVAKPTEFYFYRGRTAMYSLLRALNVRPGDEVIVQAYTCLAVPLPILATGAKPVYADVNPRTYTADPAEVRSLITSRTRAIVIQHTFGIPAQLDELLPTARENGITVLEDCCHVCGGSYSGRPLGSFGAAAFHSYQWSKPVVIGRGGSAIVNAPSLVSRVNEICRACVQPPIWETAVVQMEYLAYRALEGRPLLERLRRIVRSVLPAATGTFKKDELSFRATRDYRTRMPEGLIRRARRKLQEAEKSTETRRAITGRYHENFRQLGVSNLSLQHAPDAVLTSYPLLFSDKKRVIQEARRRRIHVDTSFSSPVEPLTTSEDWAGVGYRAGSCPLAEDLAAKTLTFPIRDRLKNSDIEAVIAFVREMARRGYLEVSKP